MKIGYPCINWRLKCKGGKTFRLKSYSQERLIDTVENNLDCLLLILRFNVLHNILFFRITSDLIPFASHPVCTFNWQKHFSAKFKQIGAFIKKHDIRISMHPDQFTLINSLDAAIFRRSEKELLYHARVLDGMKLDTCAKIQIHVGGVYGNKEKSTERFVDRYRKLNPAIKRRLVIENDDTCYNVEDCLSIHNKAGIPVLFDVFHHSINKIDLPLKDIFKKVAKTWGKRDGLPMVDYSSQLKGGKPGEHAQHIDMRDFKKFIKSVKGFDFDIMLEIKDKEKSALKAIKVKKE
ncbi:MAG: UV DNA damage repair endonuclease UvsE [Candidatus Omnitrophota bacterium]|nr:MAG: UV DNA damage repair endonuclease UvsE [Candidatus Omnitrophota bacterium]